jgi:hypothetical protein
VVQVLRQVFLDHQLHMLVAAVAVQFLAHHLHLEVLVVAVEARQIQVELLELQTLAVAAAAQTPLMTAHNTVEALEVLASLSFVTLTLLKLL